MSPSRSPRPMKSMAPAPRRAVPPRAFLAIVATALFVLSTLARGSSLPALAAPSSYPALELHAISFNIRFGTANDGDDSWPHRRQQLLDLLEREAADVIGLQEALRAQIDEITAALPAYGFVGVGRDDGKSAGEHSSILYRRERFAVEDSGTFWLSDTPEVIASKSWGNQTTRVCTWALLREQASGRPFYVFNAHLDHESQPSREEALRLIARRMTQHAHCAPSILMGDFNAGEENPAVRWLLGPRDTSAGEAPPVRLVDSYRVLHPHDAEVRTFHGFRGGTSGEKIDYVLVPAWCAVLQARIIHASRDGRYPSDHYPVSARIVFPPGGSV